MLSKSLLSAAEKAIKRVARREWEFQYYHHSRNEATVVWGDGATGIKATATYRDGRVKVESEIF